MGLLSENALKIPELATTTNEPDKNVVMIFKPDVKLDNYKGRYRINDIENARKGLMEEFYERTASNQTEIRLKRKLGVITQEVIDYYMTSPNTRNIDDEIEFIEMVQKPKDPVKIDQTALVATSSLSNASNNLGLKHACNSKTCANGYQMYDTSSNIIAFDTVFVCDFCQIIVSLESNMLKHLQESQHFSASSYYKDNENDKSIKYLRSRCCVKNYNVIESSATVFCPECSFPFQFNVLACAIHYYYQHKSSEYIYAIATPENIVDIELTKRHICTVCGVKPKKLLDLVKHLETTKHFPYMHGDNVSVFCCPTNDCIFQTTSFFSFKIHVVQHTALNIPLDRVSEEKSVYAKIKIYKKLNDYYHISKFSGANVDDKHEELLAIDSLVDILKGHTDKSEYLKKIKARKLEICKTWSKIGKPA